MVSPDPTPRTTTSNMVFGRGEWRARLAQDYAPTADRLQQAYSTTSARLMPYADAFTQQVLDFVEAGGTPTPEMIQNLSGYQRLLVQTRYEMQDFARIAQHEAERLQLVGTNSGINIAQSLVGQIGGNAASTAFLRPNPAVLSNLINYVDNPVMREKFAAFGVNASSTLADSILAGFANGQGAMQTSRLIRKFMNDIPISWANNMTRTVHVYSYRMANHAAYRANEHLLEGWRWSSARDSKTCMSCWAQEGKVFRVDETLNDHHQGRCAPIPIVRGSTLQWQTGETLFNRLPQDRQLEIMGRGAYEAYRRGDVQFGDFSRPYQDSVYGQMLRRATNRELGIAA